MPNSYDKKEIFKKQIQKKADELSELCKSFGVVSFMSFCLKDDGEETEYKNYIHGSVSNNVRLANDNIRGYINVTNGFMTVPPGDDFDSDDYFDFDD